MHRLRSSIYAAFLTLFNVMGCASEESSASKADTRPLVQGNSAEDQGVDAAPAPVAPLGEQTQVIVGEALGRPARLFLPAGYTSERSWPMIVLLHGYSANGNLQDGIFRLKLRQSERGYLLLVPEGRRDMSGRQFWAATEACCDFGPLGSMDDDVDYLGALIEESAGVAAVDRAQVSLVGHSNGGYMSYRLACERPDLISRIAVLAGTDNGLEALCQPQAPISLLHIHGDEDPTVTYTPGGVSSGAEESAQRWSAAAGCEPVPLNDGRLDLLPHIDGEETEQVRWLNC
ncbi:MAG: PHB depolymerase family esterase, partial [Myxococcota bacterium]|nr:PHB depolymerase family esterase [Myxococcota bacterium]